MELATRFLEDVPGESYFLRDKGTGKSTWCLRERRGLKRIDLLSNDVLRWYSAKAEHLREYTLGQPAGTTIVIGEVQKVPELLSVVHELL